MVTVKNLGEFTNLNTIASIFSRCLMLSLCLSNILFYRQLLETCFETLLYTMFIFGESPCSSWDERECSRQLTHVEQRQGTLVLTSDGFLILLTTGF